MKNISISTTLNLPLDLATESTAILARKGAGKSYTARRITEQLLANGVQTVILDPKGDWWGIRSSANGQTDGFSIPILGGEKADVPLEPNSGEMTAKFIVEERTNALIDLSHFRKHELATFCAAFLETLYRLKAKDANRTPMTLIVDEADAIAPQNPKGMRQSGVFDNSARMLGAAEDIVRRGRQRGIGIVMVTQRAAVLNKNVLTQTSILVLLRTTGSQDIEAIDDWIKKHGQPEERAEVMASLASLQRGEAWFWAPGWPDETGIFQRVQVGQILTFDSGATPKVGEVKTKPKHMSRVDLDKFKEKMGEVMERAKQDDPKALRKEIAELKKQLAKPISPTRDPEIEDLRAKNQFLERAVKQYSAKIEKLAKDVADLLSTIVDPNVEFAPVAKYEIPPKISVPSQAATAIKEKTLDVTEPRRNCKSINIFEEVTKPQKKILDAIAWWESVGIKSPDKQQVAFISGYKPKSGNFNNLMGQLRACGLIEYPGPGLTSLTYTGRNYAESPQLPKTVKDFHERVLFSLTVPQSKLLRVVLARYPDAVTTEELAQETGYQAGSGNFNNLKGQLRSIGLTEYPFPGATKAADWLFPSELR